MSANPALTKRMRNEFVESFIANALRDGKIMIDDLSNIEELSKKVIDLASRTNFQFTVDHRDAILSAALFHADQEELAFSIVFFATYFEHSLNFFIAEEFHRRGMAQKISAEAIRSLNLDSKSGWVLQFLGLPKLIKKHQATIRDVAAERNAFIHYKWNPDVEGHASRQKDQVRKTELVLSARKAVTYLKRYESRYIFRNKKGRISKVVRGP